MRIFCRKPSISLFDPKRPHTSIPSKFQPFGRCSFGLDRPLGRRACTSPWKKDLTPARLSRVGTSARLVMTIVLGCISCSFVAAAGKSTLTGFATEYDRWAPYVAEASQRFGVPAHWIRAVMQQESIGDKGAVSPKGAMGLMQVIPRPTRNCGSATTRRGSLPAAQQYTGGRGLSSRDARPLRPGRLSGGL